MNRRCFYLLCCATIIGLMAVLSVNVLAGDTVDSGFCGGENEGKNLTWVLDTDGVLTISGSGSMKDFEKGNVPWADRLDAIDTLTLENGVTSIGSNAFRSCKHLGGALRIPDSVVKIGEYAFYGTGFKMAAIPANVTEIGQQAFYYDNDWGGAAELSFARFLGNASQYTSDAFGSITCYYEPGKTGWDQLSGVTVKPWKESEQTASSFSMDISKGKIQIFDDGYGGLCYLQNGEAIRSTGRCVIQQSGQEPAPYGIALLNGSGTVNFADLNIETSENAIEISGSYMINLIGATKAKGTSSRYSFYEAATANAVLTGTGSLNISGSNSLNYGLLTVNGAAATFENLLNYGTVSLKSGKLTAVRIGPADYYNVNTGNTILVSGGELDAGTIGGSGSCDGMHVRITGGKVTAKNIINNPNGYSNTQYDLDIAIENAEVILGQLGDAVKAYAHATILIQNSAVTVETITGKSITVNNSTVKNAAGGGPVYTEQITIDSTFRDTSALAGNIPAVSVQAEANSGLSYQWQTSSDNSTWTDCSGATGQTSSVRVTQDTNGFYYRCRLTNGWGNTVYTGSARMWVLAVTGQPQNVNMQLDGSTGLSVTSSCENVSYQWQRSYDSGATWADVPDGIYKTLVINAAMAENQALYRCVLTAENADKAVSDSALITVSSASAITFTVQYYQQKADGTGYILTDRVITEAHTGDTATAPSREYANFTEREDLGVHTGTVTSDSSLVLSRYFDRTLYTITFESSGGSALPKLTARYGAEIEMPAAPSKYGCIFDSWYLDAQLTQPFAFQTMPGQNFTLYAKWTTVGAGRGIEYTINAIRVKSGDYTDLKQIPSGSFYAEVDVTNRSSGTMDTLVLAAYDSSGRMLELYYMYANPPIGYTFTLGTYVKNEGGEIARLKAFMLPMLGGTVPLAESREFAA